MTTYINAHLRDQNDGQCLQKMYNSYTTILQLFYQLIFLYTWNLSSYTKKKETHAITAQLLLTGLISTKKAG